jgi:hypothetical protein
MLERIRKWVALASLIFVAAIFWSAVIAVVAKYLLVLCEKQTLFFLFLRQLLLVHVFTSLDINWLVRRALMTEMRSEICQMQT